MIITLFKQLVNEGLVINNKKKSNQFALNFTDIVDVTDYDSVDDKIANILSDGTILKFFEEFEYRKHYRHFCYFNCTNITTEKIEKLVEDNKINLFDRKSETIIDDYEKPSMHVIDNILYLKFSESLNNTDGNHIKFTVICVLDIDNSIIELRFDRVGLAYKNSHVFYRDRIERIRMYLIKALGFNLENIDFKAVIDYIKDEDNVSIFAQRMQRNGTTAYLEAYDEGDGVMPILGELSNFIVTEKDIFEKSDDTKIIRNKLQKFISEIEIKSDMPMVKVKLDDKNIRFGITHNYKKKDYSLFMFYGELVDDKEAMDYVRNYLVGCCRRLKEEI